MVPVEKQKALAEALGWKVERELWGKSEAYALDRVERELHRRGLMAWYITRLLLVTPPELKMDAMLAVLKGDNGEG